MENHASSNSLLTHTLKQWIGLKGKKSKRGHIAYRMKGKEVWTNIHYLLTHTPDLCVRLKSDNEIVQISLFFIELTAES